jgi:hypothetical protein
VTLLGVVGFISTAKFRERLFLSIHRLRLLRLRLDETAPGLGLCALVEESRRANRKRFPLSSLSTRGFVWWGINLVIVLIGLIGLASLPAAQSIIDTARNWIETQ